MSAQTMLHQGRRGILAEIGLVLLITAVAASLRFYAIDEFPPGLYRDEAYNGLDALRVVRGDRPLFFEANNGREPLFIYLLALGVKLWGNTAGALRRVSALIGTLTIPCLYWLSRELYGRRVALVAILMAASSVWMLNMSRIVFRAGVMLPVLTLGLAALVRGMHRRKTGWMALAGLCFGVGAYTYLAARLAVLALIAYLAIDWHRQGKPWIRGWLALIICATMVACPMIVYWVGAGGEGRVGQVSILNPEMRDGSLAWALVTQGYKTLLGFVWRGDFIPRHNIPLRPFLPVAYGVALVSGAWIGLRRADLRVESSICLVWLAVMLVPTWLAEGAPHMLRASGILPMLYCLPALGIVRAWQWLGRHGLIGEFGMVGLALIILASSADNVLDYHEHLVGEAVYYNFEAGATELASGVNDWLVDGGEGENRVAWIAQRLWDGWPSLRFLCSERTGLSLFRQDDGPAIADGSGPILLMLWAYDPIEQALGALPVDRLVSVQEGARERQDLATESSLLYLKVTATDLAAVPANAQALWEHGIELRGYEIDIVDVQEIEVTLYWVAHEPIVADYTVFCHVLGGERLVGQHDGAPASGHYPTSWWRPGGTIRDVHRVQLSEACEGNCSIEVGLYAWPDMVNLHLVDSMGQPTPQQAYDITVYCQ